MILLKTWKDTVMKLGEIQLITSGENVGKSRWVEEEITRLMAEAIREELGLDQVEQEMIDTINNEIKTEE